MKTASGRYGGHCPACGVLVAFGMPRCPKCHNKMPWSPAPRTVRAAEDADTPWLLYIALALLVVGGLVVYLQLRDSGGGEGSARPTTDEPVEDVNTGDAGDTAESRGGDEGEQPVSARPPDVEATRLTTLRGVRRSLENRSLTGTVRVRMDAPDVVEIESEMCRDDRMSSLLDDKSASLSDQGFEALVCVDPSGVERARRNL